jgi:hypothetical protein
MLNRLEKLDRVGRIADPHLRSPVGDWPLHPVQRIAIQRPVGHRALKSLVQDPIHATLDRRDRQGFAALGRTLQQLPVQHPDMIGAPS